jgi:hypothetical protein
MRRTALFLGGLFLATGASLALAGPASAAEAGCGKSCNNGGGLAVVHSAPQPIYVLDADDECYYGNSYVSSYGHGGHGYAHGLSGGYGDGGYHNSTGQVGLLNFNSTKQGPQVGGLVGSIL